MWRSNDLQDIILVEPVELSMQPHSIIAENSSIARKKKSHVEKSGKIPIKGTGLVAWQKIRIVIALLNQ